MNGYTSVKLEKDAKEVDVSKFVATPVMDIALGDETTAYYYKIPAEKALSDIYKEVIASYNKDDKDDGLSAGAIAGIVIAVVVVVALAVGHGTYFGLKSKKQVLRRFWQR